MRRSFKNRMGRVGLVVGASALPHAGLAAAPGIEGATGSWKLETEALLDRGQSPARHCTATKAGLQITLHRSGEVTLGFTDRRSVVDPDEDDVDGIDLIAVSTDRATLKAHFERADNHGLSEAKRIAGVGGPVVFGGGFVALADGAGPSLPAQAYLSVFVKAKLVELTYRNQRGVTKTLVDMTGITNALTACARAIA